MLDDFGLGLALANGYELAIGAANGNPGWCNVTCCGSGKPIFDYSLVSFTLGPAGVAAAAPEPSTWVMMISGLPVLRFLGVRRSRRRLALAAAR